MVDGLGDPRVGGRVEPPLQVVALDHQRRPGKLALLLALPPRAGVDEDRRRPRPSRRLGAGRGGRGGRGRRPAGRRRVVIPLPPPGPVSTRAGAAQPRTGPAHRVVRHRRQRRRVGVHAHRGHRGGVGDVVHVPEREADAAPGPQPARPQAARRGHPAPLDQAARDHGERPERAGVVVQVGVLLGGPADQPHVDVAVAAQPVPARVRDRRRDGVACPRAPRRRRDGSVR